VIYFVHNSVYVLVCKMKKLVFWIIFYVFIILFIIMPIAGLGYAAWIIAPILKVKSWILTPIVLVLVVGLIFLFGWLDEIKWKKAKHVPRWVNKRVKILLKEYTINPDLESKKFTYLTGRWFVYKISFAGENWQEISIYRKRKPIKKEGAVLNCPPYKNL